jgi:hypothetical protein
LQANIHDLKSKLKAGKNEKSEGYQKFAAAQFYENLTKEQYAGSYRPRLSIFNSSRDALNPFVNAETLRNRLWVIDHYRFRYGASHTYWVHTALSRAFKRVNTYKFNYLLKAFLAYNVYSRYQTYKYVDDMTFMSETQRGMYRFPIVAGTAAFGAVCLLI